MNTSISGFCREVVKNQDLFEESEDTKTNDSKTSDDENNEDENGDEGEEDDTESDETCPQNSYAWKELIRDDHELSAMSEHLHIQASLENEQSRVAKLEMQVRLLNETITHISEDLENKTKTNGFDELYKPMISVCLAATANKKIFKNPEQLTTAMRNAALSYLTRREKLIKYLRETKECESIIKKMEKVLFVEPSILNEMAQEIYNQLGKRLCR